MDQRKPCPVIWALGNKGYLVQSPLIAALGARSPVLAVTNSSNIHLQSIRDNNQLLHVLTTPDNWIGGIRFLFNLNNTRNQLVDKLRLHASVIHVVMCSPWDIFFLGILAKVGVPIIVTIHDAVQHKGEESVVMDYLRDWCISKADLVTVLSAHVSQELQRNPKFNKPLHVLDNGLVMHAKPALEARPYPQHRPIKLLFHGRIHAYKGLDLLLDAMHILQRKGKNYALTIAGSGELGTYQDKLKGLRHVTVQNRFLSEDDLYELLSNHDVSVLPYLEASQSAVAIDAHWAALPAVATPVGALPKQFTDGYDALITAKTDAQSIADVIERICDDNILYQHLSQGAAQSYQKSGPQQASRQWIDLYNQTIHTYSTHHV